MRWNQLAVYARGLLLAGMLLVAAVFAVLVRWRTLGGERAALSDVLVLSESLRVGNPASTRQAVDDAPRVDPGLNLSLARARALLAEGNVFAAAAEYRLALDVSPDHPEALVGVGRIALVHGDLAGAATDFERVLARNPADLDARIGLGLVRGRQARPDEAIVLLEAVVREAPSNPEGLSALGAALARTGAPGRAIPYLQRAVEAGGRTPATLNDLGFARLEAGDRVGAIAALRGSLTLKSDQPAIAQVVRDLTDELPARRDLR